MRHLKGKIRCPLEGVSEDAIQSAFVTMWNKLISNYEDILVLLLDSLKRFSIGGEQAAQICECENRKFELTQQRKILRASAAKGYLDAAVFYERLGRINHGKTEVNTDGSATVRKIFSDYYNGKPR